LSNEPTKVLLRIYGENHHNNSSIILKDVVVSAIMSDKGFGPKLYGIFTQGRLEEYIQSKQLNSYELQDRLINEKIAKLLAEFHTLEMPFVKEPKWLFDTIERYLNIINNLSNNTNQTSIKFTDKDELKKFKKLISFNLNDEFNRLKQILETLNSPVVFCHNDLQPGNILKLLNGNMLVIDYEYGSYNYRGFDIGNYFCEWMMNNNYDTYPYFKCKPELYPTKEQQLNFIRSYLNEYKKINTHLNRNRSDLFNEDKLLKEANYFALASHFFWSIWSIVQAATTKIQFSYLDYGITRMNLYFELKQKLIQSTTPPTTTTTTECKDLNESR
jgi:choline/ethanolamine kinase